MIKNAKAKGRRNEHKSMKLFEAMGYRCTRSGASLGCWDFIGIGATDLVLVQVKTGQWPGIEETESMRLFKAPPNAKKIIHRWNNYKRMPDMKEL